jgi:hypothetical protein
MLLRCLLLTLLCAFGLPFAHAQDMFRSVMPDGKIVYSDKPAPGAKESKKINLAPLNIATPQQAPDTVPPPPGTAGPTVDKNAELAAARQRLEAAQKALEAGREQREGDRLGVAKGSGATSRPSESYLERVKQLEDAVNSAQQQVDTTQRDAR